MDDFEAISTKFEARKFGMRHSKDGHILSLVVHPQDTPHELLQDLIGQRYLIVAVRLDTDDQPVASPKTQKANAAVASAGELCRDERFMEWLAMTGEIDEMSSDAAAAAVRRLCQVKSRKELATNEQALSRFLDLKENFIQYLRSQ